MCMHKKKPKPPLPKSGKVPSSQPLSKPPPSKKSAAKKTDSNPSKVSDKSKAGGSAPHPSQPSSSSLKEQTCISEKSEVMQISIYKPKGKNKDGGSGSGPIPIHKPKEQEDSPEVFENAQAVSLHPLNVTQIFVDSVVPQTNLSKQHTDILDQNTLENVDLNMDDQIYPEMDADQESNPEMPQPRPRANVLQPEDETLKDTLSDRIAWKKKTSSEHRMTMTRTARASRPSTPDKLPSAFTPPPSSRTDDKHVGHQMGKRTPRTGMSTRTTVTARVKTSPNTEHRQLLAQYDHPKDVANTCPSNEAIDRITLRTSRAPVTTHRTVATAMPIEPKDTTCPSREAIDTATAKQPSNMYKTAHMYHFDP